jgi:alpha-L-arabinofuranosidase
MTQPLTIDPRPTNDLSPYLYMQFMEPLGATDGSVEAAWDHLRDDWREDVVETTRELAPSMLRWGGCFSSYYRWQEGVGPRGARKPMFNLLWGGMESNQVGTAEFVDFSRRVGAEPLIGVNFESDGRQGWAFPPSGGAAGKGRGGGRRAGPEEAAAWVAYCNDPANSLRLAHGRPEPYNVRFWQIGNETSYDPHGYDLETAASRTLAFARAMRHADPTIRLIGWGDDGHAGSGWAAHMLEICGEELDFLAFHNMFRAGSDRPDSPLRGVEYRKDPARTWEHLMEAWREPEAKIRRMRAQTAGSAVPLAITECHFTLPGRNRGEVLSTWAAGVADARILNVHERHGDRVKIATLADFCGTRWQVNAVMIPVPHGKAYLMPVARVMSLYRRHTGRQAVAVTGAPAGLDVTASRAGDTLYLHIVNTQRTAAVTMQLAVEGLTISGGRVFEIAADPEFEVLEGSEDILAPQEKPLPAGGLWTFPPASVSAVEINCLPV